MIPAMIASVLILYWYWRENQPRPGEPVPGSAEALEAQIAELERRLDRVIDGMRKG